MNAIKKLFACSAALLLAACFLNNETAGTTDETETGNEIRLVGRVLDRDNAPVPGVLAQLAKTGLADTTDSHGKYLIYREAEEKGSTKLSADEVLDTLVFYQGGLKLTSLDVLKWVDSLPDIKVVQRDLSGEFAVSGVEIGMIEAVLTGDGIPSEQPVITELGYLGATGRYSGFVYFPFAPETQHYSVYINIYDKEGVFIGRSITVDFDSRIGDLVIPEFDAENAKPVVNAGNDTTLSVNDTIHLQGWAEDAFGGTIVKQEWDIGNTGDFVESGGDTAIAAPATAQTWELVFRATDDDGNREADTLVIDVLQDAPAVQAYAFPATVSIHDTIYLEYRATDEFGSIVKLEWDIGNTRDFVEVPGGDTTVTAPSTEQTYELVFRATDDDGNTRVDTATVNVLQDPPVARIITAGRSVRADSLFAISSGLSYAGVFGSLVRREWSIGSFDNFIETGASDTMITAPSEESDSFVVVLRVIDDDSNASLDTMYINVYKDWEVVGYAGFSDASVRCLSMAVDSANRLYIAFPNRTNNIKAAVMCFNGTDWEYVGGSGFSDSVAGFPSIAIDSANMPYVAFVEESNASKVKVMRFNGQGWETVGPDGLSGGPSAYTSMTTDDSGIPYVAFQDFNNHYKITVMRLHGSEWEVVGEYAPDSAVQHLSLAIDRTGKPYIACLGAQEEGRVTVMRLDGSTWEDLGPAGSSASAHVSIMIDGENTPCVALSENETVRYNGSSWEQAGTILSVMKQEATGVNRICYSEVGCYVKDREGFLYRASANTWLTVEILR